MAGDRARVRATAAWQNASHRATARQIIFDPDPLDFPADVPYETVRAPRRTGRILERLELRCQVIGVDFEALALCDHVVSFHCCCRTKCGTVSGNNRSTKRSAVGCGSWPEPRGLTLHDRNGSSRRSRSGTIETRLSDLQRSP